MACGSGEKAEGLMLDLQLVRGPLASNPDYRTIIADFSRLSEQSPITERLMRRWCNDSPAGPALHAFLKTDEGKLVGHACVFPFPMEVAGRTVTGGKGEYLYVHNDFRREAVRGMECRLPPSILMLRQLFSHASEQLRWDPILISPLPVAEAVLQSAGCRPAVFPYFHCLLIRRPWNACRFGPNRSLAKRVALLLVGLFQTSIWAVLRRLFLPLRRNIQPLPIHERFPSNSKLQKARFSSDPDYLAWRYPAEGFHRFGFANRPHASVIIQKGSPERFLRVCQTNLDGLDFPVVSLIAGLMEQARSCQAIGVRWAIYDHGYPPMAVVNKLRHLGFACMRRQRKIMIYTRHPELADPSYWSFDGSFDDSLFTGSKRAGKGLHGTRKAFGTFRGLDA
jgi:hypothetical protein